MLGRERLCPIMIELRQARDAIIDLTLLGRQNTPGESLNNPINSNISLLIQWQVLNIRVCLPSVEKVTFLL